MRDASAAIPIITLVGFDRKVGLGFPEPGPEKHSNSRQSSSRKLSQEPGGPGIYVCKRRHGYLTS